MFNGMLMFALPWVWTVDIHIPSVWPDVSSPILSTPGFWPVVRVSKEDLEWSEDDARSS